MSPLGTKYCTLRTNILGVSLVKGRHRAFQIPKGATVRIMRFVENTTEVLWEDRVIAVFTEDLESRSVPLKAATAWYRSGLSGFDLITN